MSNKLLLSLTLINRLVLKAIAAIALTATPASAATIYIDYDLSSYLTNAGATSLISIQQFDPSLGTLNGVVLELEAATGGTISNMCFFASPCTNASYSNVSLGALSLGGLEVVVTENTSSGVVTIPVGLSSMVLTGEESESVNGSTLPILSAFTGTSQLTGSLYSRGAAGCANLGACNAGTGYFGGGTQSLNLRVLYDYAATAAVPEPSSWAMMLLGFGAVGFSMRRRRQIIPQMT